MTTKNLLLALLMLALFVTGFVLGRFSVQSGVALLPGTASNTTQTQSEDTTEDTNTADTQAETTSVGTQMTDAQRNMLKSFGLDPDTITITDAMVACAEAKVGAARVAEIVAGATPSFMEGASLMACYGQ